MRAIAVAGAIALALALAACVGNASTPSAQPTATPALMPTEPPAPTAAAEEPLASPGATRPVGSTPIAPLATPVATPVAATPGAAAAFPRSVAEAEAEGRAFPTAPSPAAKATFQGALGTAERRCVAVDSYRGAASSSGAPSSGTPDEAAVVLRSGDFIAGPLLIYAEEWARDPGSGKIWWDPLHTATMPGLTIRAILLDDPAISRVFTALPASSPAGLFYPSGVRVPQPGEWMLIATAGPDWGCFTLRVGR